MTDTDHDAEERGAMTETDLRDVSDLDAIDDALQAARRRAGALVDRCGRARALVDQIRFAQDEAARLRNLLDRRSLRALLDDEIFRLLDAEERERVVKRRRASGPHG